jgi:hypothetical protein
MKIKYDDDSITVSVGGGYVFIPVYTDTYTINNPKILQYDL